ncbi:periplasmic heavy metal sensor [Jannaschia pohangensis]|uniref:Uncharacterized membrane protein n=1 Tax=Jannaschia pohangensis TaxID=390807 RepID=A0A1I3J9L0_9RHOB|nr:periplasmic heavy metal sensor [Jannaschia pohangensis]SFI56944.1 Uncharacterized membrane protein [Jannaschia pohangensis]
MTPPPTPKDRPRRNWTRWALIASLLVNVLIAGLVVGALSQGRPETRGGNGSDFRGPPEIAALIRGLDRPQRRALLEAMRDVPGLREGRGRMGRVQAEVLDALEAEPFDSAALEAALSDRRQVQDDLARAGITAFVGFVAEMSPEDRARLATQARERAERRSRRD